MAEISVIIPVYNKEKYVCKIIKDLRSQSFSNFECIIIDDGSIDTSGVLCDQMTQDDERFLVIHIANGGASHARNIGLKKATGKYLTFVDADDRIAENYLQKLHERAISSQADMVISGYEKFWADTDKKQYTSLPYIGLCKMNSLLPDFAHIQQETGVYGFCCGKLVRKDVIGPAKFDEKIKLAEDFEFYLQIYPRIKSIFFEQECKYRYLQEAENSTALLDDSQIDYLSQLFIHLRYKSFLKKMDAYIGENLEIVEQRISNYVFFTVYHSPRKELREMVREINRLQIENDILLKPTNFFQKTIFWGICHNTGWMIEGIMCMYDFVRKLMKGNE